MWKCNRFVVTILILLFLFASRTVIHGYTVGLTERSKSIIAIAILLPVMPAKYEGKSAGGSVQAYLVLLCLHELFNVWQPYTEQV